MANWDIVALGRIVGALIVVVGVGLAGWDAIELDGQGHLGSNFAVRYFLSQSLNALGTGVLVILAAEIAHRLWQDRSEARPPAGDLATPNDHLEVEEATTAP